MAAAYEVDETYWLLTLPDEWPIQTRVEASDFEATLADLRTRYRVVRKTFTLDNYTLTHGEQPSAYVGDAPRYGHLSRVDTYRPA
jgi:hypothetical protein